MDSLYKLRINVSMCSSYKSVTPRVFHAVFNRTKLTQMHW